MLTPLILEIKGNSLDDGPGIRSAVFFKGCPLNCIWCHNPESKSFKAELSYDHNTCIGDGTCALHCDQKAITPGLIDVVDRSKCNLCFKCTTVCPAKSLSIVGKSMSQEELIKKLASDKVFYDVSGGGVTLSGGEATMATEWVGGVAKALHEQGINVLLETCGHFEYSKVENFILPYLKNIFCDIKLINEEDHLKYCGISNALILENIKKLHADSDKYGYDFLPRTPLIPGITDTEENLKGIANFLKENNILKTQLLAYNPTWHHKLEKIGKELADELKDKTSFQSKDQLTKAKEIYESLGIECI